MQNKTLFTLLCLSTTIFATSVLAQDSTTKEQELIDTMDVIEKENTAEILDFPTRSSLGTLELATLPGASESLISGPAEMGQSLSIKDLPSEQLLGRITSDVFQEMAELERSTIFLKLQMQNEQLKNDLERLRASYRQARLDEIAQREDVVKSRIEWWQEQESVRLEKEEKQKEIESIEQQLAEANELRNSLREQAMQQINSEPIYDEFGNEIVPQVPEIIGPIEAFSDTYRLVGVRGVKNNLIARLQMVDNNKIISAKIDEKMPNSYVINGIFKDYIIVSINNIDERIDITSAVQDQDAE